MHKLPHGIQGSLRRVDLPWHAELEAADRKAAQRGMCIAPRGARHYAVDTLAEYRAEGAQWWFRGNDPDVFVSDGPMDMHHDRK